MTILAIVEVLGRFHPVLVHLPIGILLVACLFQLFVKRFPLLRPSVPVLLFWGMLAAVASCITGYLLSLSGDYDAVLTRRHQWLGIITAAAAFLFYMLHRLSLASRYANPMAAGVIALIMVTGHLGGSLTHGTDYLTAGMDDAGADQTMKPIPNIQEAVLYTAVVQPILQRKCYSCHGSSKQKGKLRLDEENYILKGGKDGKAIESGKPDESAMIKRLLLPLNDDDHMPPKEKPQLTPNEVAVLNWWVSTGNSFTKKVKELPQTDKIKPVLAALQSGSGGNVAKSADVPDAAVSAASEDAVNKLKDAGVMVVPVAHEKNYLSVNFVTAGNQARQLVKLLEPLKKQLVWLRLDGSDIDDAALAAIAKLEGLTRLYLSNTAITDAGLQHLKPLKQLQVLNLVGTKVTDKGVAELKTMPALRAIYLYKTNINRNAWVQLKRAFPKTILDSGGYNVPTLVTDTTLVTADQQKK
ncbi:c-type cytochrome domain-containing protein [Niabella aurantiaca]|uniref:c-type cytochrome domain-containing protein n=1 Tax=Niabella aurantiaca TaxID=379900 RepID=UPI000362F0F4|nr:c-type cytochrome domain-containing protein [Niabella aurantiaca]